MDTLLCATCYSRIDFFSQPIKLKSDHPYLDQLIALAHYEGVIKKLVTALKYEGVYEVGIALGRLLFYCCSIPDCAYITAVPIHHKRHRERGFNQAEIIAKEVSNHIQKPYFQFLTRTIHSVPQASISDRNERLTHLQNHFALNLKILVRHSIMGKTILLIDDVCTTGSTLQECARVLKEHGAARVIGLTIAHGSY